jgi:hypothetical protein
MSARRSRLVEALRADDVTLRLVEAPTGARLDGSADVLEFADGTDFVGPAARRHRSQATGSRGS